MANQGVGTAVELLAAASLFDVPVYTLVPHKDAYHWLRYKPLENAKLVYPASHYDVIVFNNGGVFRASGFSGMEWWTVMVEWNGGMVISWILLTSMYRPPLNKTTCK